MPFHRVFRSHLSHPEDHGSSALTEVVDGALAKLTELPAIQSGFAVGFAVLGSFGGSDSAIQCSGDNAVKSNALKKSGYKR